MIDTIINITSLYMLIGCLVFASEQIIFKPVPARVNQLLRRPRDLEHR